MLADDFNWLRDARKIDRLAPRKQLRKISQELTGLLFGETDTKPAGGRDKELAQGTLMFHVEQLREMRKEVKSLYEETGSVSRAAETASRGEDFLLCFSRATSSTEIAAGVIPEILDA